MPSTPEEMKAAYCSQLRRMKQRLKTLQGRYDAIDRTIDQATGINWAHVGDLAHVNAVLDEALLFELKPVGEKTKAAG